MTEPTALLVANLIDAFKQLNQLFALGLVSSVSALALSRRASTPVNGDAIAPPGFVAMSRENAQLVLVGVSFVAGLMGSYAAESVSNIVGLLHTSPELLRAVCTYSSVATAPVGIPVAACALPVAFAGTVIVLKWHSLREQGLLIMLFIFIAPYAIMAMTLGRLPCRAS